MKRTKTRPHVSLAETCRDALVSRPIMNQVIARRHAERAIQAGGLLPRRMPVRRNDNGLVPSPAALVWRSIKEPCHARQRRPIPPKWRSHLG